jgi:hypothetical protein
MMCKINGNRLIAFKNNYSYYCREKTGAKIKLPAEQLIMEKQVQTHRISGD